MIEVADNLLIGTSGDAQSAKVDSILNVARDLKCVRGWPTHEYAQVGLVDGPGNEVGLYFAATLTLYAMMTMGRVKKRVLVHCHDGKSRSMAVAIMYLHMLNGRGWDSNMAAIRERVEVEVPDPHEAHKAAFDKMDWRILRYVIEIK